MKTKDVTLITEKDAEGLFVIITAIYMSEDQIKITNMLVSFIPLEADWPFLQFFRSR